MFASIGFAAFLGWVTYVGFIVPLKQVYIIAHALVHAGLASAFPLLTSHLRDES